MTVPIQLNRLIKSIFRQHWICLVALMFAPACHSATPPTTTAKEFKGATPLEWSVRMADSETSRLGDKRAWRPGRSVKWDYTAGLFTLSLLKLNEKIPTPAYVEFSKDTIGSRRMAASKVTRWRNTTLITSRRARR